MENQFLIQFPKVSFSDFQKEKIIGKGGYGEVFLAKHITTEKKSALKVLNAEELAGKDNIYFYSELLSLSQINNMFVIKLLGYSDSFPFCIETEYADCGTLFDALSHKPRSPRLDSSQKTLIAMGIAYGMISVHQANIIHRDLKSSNILLDENHLPKISDFGLSLIKSDQKEINDLIQKVDTESKFEAKIIGTPGWMAPEMYDGIEDYTNKVDVYEYGVLLWEMATESIPFRNMDPLAIMTAVVIQNKRPNIPSNISASFKKLIQSCWDKDPENRPSFNQIFDLFANKQVYFPQTNLHKVDAMIEYISKKTVKK